MPFRIKQKFVPAGAGSAFETRTNTLDNGNCVTVSRDVTSPLPSPDSFRLSALLKAGVGLEKVSTKIIDGRSTFELPISSDEVNNNEE